MGYSGQYVATLIIVAIKYTTVGNSITFVLKNRNEVLFIYSNGTSFIVNNF